MKACQCCLQIEADDNAHPCFHCGEASWMPVPSTSSNPSVPPPSVPPPSEPLPPVLDTELAGLSLEGGPVGDDLPEPPVPELTEEQKAFDASLAGEDAEAPAAETTTEAPAAKPTRAQRRAAAKAAKG